ncbi:hypothetical protein HZB78_02870 [Candidatus Collierbacteria bacterium]|nr:hypothetical protein [Candidatus Collierbacteria bacterium]
MLGKPLAIFAIILFLAAFLPKPVSAQTPGPSCPAGMNQYKNTGMCARPEAVRFCDTVLTGVLLGNITNSIAPGFPGWCLEQISKGANADLFCTAMSAPAILQTFINPIAGITGLITNSTCKPAAQRFFSQTSGTLVSGLINPVYSPDCGSDSTGVKTGLGCLSTNPQILVNTVLPWAIGIGSGIAFLLGLYGALMIVISAGDPEKMQAGKEMITSAVSGLLIIIFAVFILRFIGVDILQLFDVNNN